MTGSKKKPAAKKKAGSKKKAPAKKKRTPSRRTKRGPKTADEVIEKVTDQDVVDQMLRASVACSRRVEKLVEKGQDIPMNLIGAVRTYGEILAEHTMVKSALPDLHGDGEQG